MARVATAGTANDASAPAWLVRAATALVAVTYVLLVFGSTVRVHGAGLACPDWPLCFGDVVPQLNFEVFLEWGHRVLAGSISVGFVVLGIAVLRSAALRARAGAVWLVAATVLAVQIVLGGLTVLELLAQWTVTSHLLAGNTFCAMLMLLTRRIAQDRLAAPSPVAGPGRLMAVGLAVLVIAQFALGGLVSSSHAGLACGPTFPSCGGASWAPTFSGLVGLQVMHRITAFAVLAGAIAVAASVRGGPAGRAAKVVLAIVCGQVILGISNVLLLMPVEVTILHSAGAAAVFLSTAWLNDEVRRAPAPDALVRPDAAPTLAEAR